VAIILIYAASAGKARPIVQRPANNLDMTNSIEMPRNNIEKQIMEKRSIEKQNRKAVWA
jgi:hypothetical protein